MGFLADTHTHTQHTQHAHTAHTDTAHSGQLLGGKQLQVSSRGACLTVDASAQARSLHLPADCVGTRQNDNSPQETDGVKGQG